MSVHPQHVLDHQDLALLGLWRAYRGGLERTGHLPSAGGAGDQACCTMASFAVMDEALEDLRAARGGVESEGEKEHG